MVVQTQLLEWEALTLRRLMSYIYIYIYIYIYTQGVSGGIVNLEFYYVRSGCTGTVVGVEGFNP